MKADSAGGRLMILPLYQGQMRNPLCGLGEVCTSPVIDEKVSR
jgi:hypothetical protein